MLLRNPLLTGTDIMCIRAITRLLFLH
jgi:hypothetical protein